LLRFLVNVSSALGEKFPLKPLLVPCRFADEVY
jgi:hypothetical protein